MIYEYVLPGEDVFPEGITEDPDGRTFYVSSERHGTIFRGRVDTPQVEIWQPAGQDGRVQALGMDVDGAGRLLVCGGSTGHLFAFDTVTGAQVARRTVSSSRTLLNDVFVHGGYAYVTDSVEPVVWRFALDGGDGSVGVDGGVDAGVGVPEAWVDLRDFGVQSDVPSYLNGIVATPDQASLVVAAQGTGVLWCIDVAGRRPALIDLGGVPVNGDGLLFVGDVLYVGDNTDEPDGSARYWLTAIRLRAGNRSGEVLGRWERRVSDTPTTLACLAGRLYLVNSQFAGKKNGTAKPPFTVVALEPPL